MSRTVAQIEQAMAEATDDYITGTVSANGVSGGTTVVTQTQDILARPGESFVPWLLEITGTVSGCQNEVRRISDVTVASGTATFTVVNAFSDQIDATDTFRLHREASPTEKIRAISRAITRIHDVLPRIIVEELLAGELLRNHNFEHWRASDCYDWEAGSTGTVTKETSTKYQGDAALKLSDANGTASQRIHLERDVEDETLVFTCWVNGKTSNGARIGITANGSTTYSSALASDDTWEELSVELEITDPTQPIYAVLDKGSGADAGYYDAAHLKIDEQESVSIIPASDAIHELRRIEYRSGIDQAASTRPSQLDYVIPAYTPDLAPAVTKWNRYYWYEGRIVRDHFLILRGIGVWPPVSAMTDTIDIDIHQEPLVAVRANMELATLMLRGDRQSDKEFWSELYNSMAAEEAALVPRLRVHPPTKHLNVPVRG